MKTKISIDYEGLIAEIGRRGINDILREAFLAAGVHWGKNFLPKHFTRRGAREYGYTPRKGENMRAGGKRFARFAGPAEKKAGEILPLVYSGELRQASQYYRVTAKATSKRVYVDVTLPNAHGFNRLDEKYRDDISKISDAELGILVGVINAEITRGLNGLRTRRREQVA